jgi:hypothetical protein
MKRLSIFLTLLLMIVRAYSQEGSCNCSSADEYSRWLLKGLIGVEYFNPVNGFKGSQYLQDWAYGDVELTDGEIIRDVIIRYDRYADQLLWLRKMDYRKGMLNKDIITGFTVKDFWNKPQSHFTKRRIFLPWLDSTEVFLQEMVVGDISFYVYRKVKEEPVEYSLMDNTRYILETGGKDYVIPLKRKSLLELPFIVKADMKKVLRHNRISVLNNEKGMTMAIDFYNRRNK